MTTDTTATTPADDVHQRAVDAAMTVFERHLNLMAPPAHVVAEAIEAVGEVYAADQQADVDRMMRETGFISMEATQDGGIQLRLKAAHDIAAAMCSAFDALIHVHGAENYVEWAATVTDPAREIAIRAGDPDPLPPHRQYSFIVVRPGGKTPHQLRQDADARAEQLRVERDWLLAEADDDTRARYAQAHAAEAAGR